VAEDTLTIKLEGEIAVADLAEALKRFDGFVRALAAEVDPKATVGVDVENLAAGSALVVSQISTREPRVLVETIQLYHETTQRIARNQPLTDHTRRVRTWGERIRELPLLASVTSARLESVLGEAIVVRPDERSDDASISLRYSRGALRGRVETISRRRGLRFVLYDLLHDAPVSCYLVAGQEEQLRGVWGRIVLVRGEIGRDERTWRPEIVRRISGITILDEVEPGSYLALRGRWAAPKGSGEPEDRIRSMRDDEDATS
jgi:hypothetical protein